MCDKRLRICCACVVCVRIEELSSVHIREFVGSIREYVMYVVCVCEKVCMKNVLCSCVCQSV